jgi:imidazolonepropionase-like amidohydrolase
MKNLLLLFSLFYLGTFCHSQVTYPVNGVHHTYDPATAYVHAEVIKSNGQKINDAIILVEKGRIKAVGSTAEVKIPAGYVLVDLKGYRIYPSFIDLNASYGMPDSKREGGRRNSSEISDKPGSHYWNEAIHPEINAAQYYAVDQKKADQMLKTGFGVALVHKKDGIARGTGALVTYAPEQENLNYVSGMASTHYSFSKGVSNQDYPSSLMGSIALLRQSLYDANWYAAQPTETNYSLKAFNDTKLLPAFFEAGSIHQILRADKLGDEFGKQFIMIGGGDEYQYINELKASQAAVILPLNFPAAYELKSPADLLNMRLVDMQHWEMAPANAYLLHQNKITYAFTFEGLKSETEFKKAIKKAMAYGLTEADILAALTSTPAKLIKQEKEIGGLEIGMIANFFVTDGNYFDDNTSLFAHCIKGKMYPAVDRSLPDARGKYKLLQANGDSVVFELSGKKSDPTLKWSYPDEKGKKNIETQTHPYRILTTSMVYELNLTGQKATVKAITLNGQAVTYSGNKEALAPEKEKEQEIKTIPKDYQFLLPYQYQTTANTTLIKDATVWTSDVDGNKIEWDVLIENGKIKQLALEITAQNGWTVIDGKGLHLTPGLIDEHSHIAISSGVNEGTQAVTSEVRIGDVINPQDVNIYRQLGGGVTTSHLLHGSANPIGGQTALIKMRYGLSAEALKLGTEHRFIKFALGENVKQSNWGDNKTSRFPQTRMGVEQCMKDAFTRAKLYKKTFGTPAFRQDLELDALVEILDGKRHITCHSYQQGEINMLIHLADSLGFKVNTFTHILEGYKVADKMKAHGAAASTFADWWGYKFEVNDAIPYNAALLNEVGILTGINSDDAEMGRRLNQEAAKTIKYGGVSEIDAIKMVTINPAKILHIDKQTGSIAVGKDADLVLWNGDPLSIYSTVIYTWVDGKIYFSKTEDLAWQTKIETEKMRLWQAMHSAAKKGEATQKPVIKDEILYHCDDE